MASKDHKAASGLEPTRQTAKSIHPIPATTVQEEEKERTKVARAKEKEKAKSDKGKSCKGAVKGKQKDSAKAASSTGGQANASTGNL